MPHSVAGYHSPVLNTAYWTPHECELWQIHTFHWDQRAGGQTVPVLAAPWPKHSQQQHHSFENNGPGMSKSSSAVRCPEKMLWTFDWREVISWGAVKDSGGSAGDDNGWKVGPHDLRRPGKTVSWPLGMKSRSQGLKIYKWLSTHNWRKYHDLAAHEKLDAKHHSNVASREKKPSWLQKEDNND